MARRSRLLWSRGFGLVRLPCSQRMARNSEKLIASREIEIGRTFRINLGPDMRAVEAAMLSSPDWEAVPLKTPEEIAEHLGRTFSRYSYPEVFFLWHVKSPTFFSRAGTGCLPG